ncbi:16S rRNA (cytosine(1402)-N(4))-methyltransferase RsmH [Roseofilum casamattae]|uniref:Ribosomal RNA small subunit methyltransferase H n=1 Tax=Roseofilum casamattae BLCC-M143 TaxID=3022442 RepID=A0ABT7C0X4_9CYAN|nr:16S rRNA (cytosine(1402)-N(4))-methyltransferase RsmH [Roseofilum casamattae BLCC-M143]
MDRPNETEFAHIPVLGTELVGGLQVRPGGVYLDATVGGGGHSLLLLQQSDRIEIMAIDRDEMALQAARQTLAKYAHCLTFWHGNFAEYPGTAEQFDGIMTDLGVSSAQLDIPERGFSFRHEAPLDMRMDRRQELTAADLVNHSDERELADIFYHYGEERLSRRIARRIVENRPFETTTELARTVASCYPPRARHGRIHPATRVFQALRIAVNAELSGLEQFLDRATEWLKPGGVLGIISFHSLEDRCVKHYFKGCDRLEIITKKPITAGEEETRNNPRSRSAKLRLARRR